LLGVNAWRGFPTLDVIHDRWGGVDPISGAAARRIPVRPATARTASAGAQTTDSGLVLLADACAALFVLLTTNSRSSPSWRRPEGAAKCVAQREYRAGSALMTTTRSPCWPCCGSQWP
jgi:hypothetical protein